MDNGAVSKELKDKFIEAFKKQKYVYIQGVWKAKLVENHGDYVRCIPLEGVSPRDKGKVFTYRSHLIEYSRRPIRSHKH